MQGYGEPKGAAFSFSSTEISIARDHSLQPTLAVAGRHGRPRNPISGFFPRCSRFNGKDRKEELVIWQTIRRNSSG